MGHYGNQDKNGKTDRDAVLDEDLIRAGGARSRNHVLDGVQSAIAVHVRCMLSPVRPSVLSFVCLSVCLSVCNFRALYSDG